MQSHLCITVSFFYVCEAQRCVECVLYVINIIVACYVCCRKDFGAYREDLAVSIVPFLNAARNMVITSAQTILIFILILVLVDTLCAVLWIYLKR